VESTSAPTINTYISDMLALEQHIATPLENQLNESDVANYSPALRVVRETYEGVQTRINALNARLDAVGGHAGSPIKHAISSVLGVAASAIDKSRKTAMSKALRDDYTALCLASAGYTMLHTTALGLRDEVTAALAQQHLADVAEQIMKISSTLPVIVLEELKGMGVPLEPSLCAIAEQDAEAAWKEGARRSGSASAN
jgi:hypothetical protein